MYIYSLYDSKAELYLNPIAADADAIVIRQFRELAKDKSIPVGQYPEDFELHKLGTFDTRTGEILKAFEIKIIAKASDFFVTPTDSPSENVIGEVKENENFQ